MRASIRLRPVLRSIARWAPVLSVVALVAFGVTAVALSQLNRDESIETRAIVIAEELLISIDELPATIDVLWERSGIAARAIETAGLSVDEADLRNDVIEVMAVRGTPVVQVVALGDDAQETVTTANAVADALVATLNESGGLGAFEIFEAATLERADEPTQLPTVPLAFFAAIVATFLALLVIFLVVDPVHDRGDLAIVSEAEFVEEAWIETGPPIIGAARALAERLAELDVDVRLLHSGRGDDLTAPLATLIERLNPRVRLTGSPHATSGAAPETTRDVLLIPEGTPRRQVLRAEASARRLLVTVLVHQGLA